MALLRTKAIMSLVSETTKTIPTTRLEVPRDAAWQTLSKMNYARRLIKLLKCKNYMCCEAIQKNRHPTQIALGAKKLTNCRHPTEHTDVVREMPKNPSKKSPDADNHHRGRSYWERNRHCAAVKNHPSLFPNQETLPQKAAPRTSP